MRAKLVLDWTLEEKGKNWGGLNEVRTLSGELAVLRA